MSKLSTLANMIAGRRKRRVKTVVAMPAIYWTCPFSKKKPEKQAAEREEAAMQRKPGRRSTRGR